MAKISGDAEEGLLQDQAEAELWTGILNSVDNVVI